jgi:hypothetical protein
VHVLLKWLQGARWRMSLAHSLEALALQPLFGLGFWLGGYSVPHSALFGAFGVAVYYYSREKSQYEQEVKVPGESNTSVTVAGVWPGDWSRESLLDWVFPVASSSAIAVGLFYLHSYIHGVLP